MESLYKLYAFGIQRGYVIELLILASLLAISLGAINFGLAQAATLRAVSFTALGTLFIALTLLLVYFRQKNRLLTWVAGVILIAFGLLASFLASSIRLDSWVPNGPQIFFAPSEGVWLVLWVVFATYTMIPMRMLHCFLFGISLSAIHLFTSAIFSDILIGPFLWQQVKKKTKIRVLRGF